MEHSSAIFSAAEKQEPHRQHLTFATDLSFLLGSHPVPPPKLKHLESPYEWTRHYKGVLTGVSCIATLFASFAASCYSPGAAQMEAEWHVSQVASLVGITTFTSGFAIGPMFLAPFSEIYGRKPVFIATAILFTICQVCCAVTRLYSGMLVARFFCGIGGSTFSTMVGGIIADIYHAQNRNAPMALFSWAALFGTGLGPLACGFISQYTGWRWIFYIQIIIAGLITAAVLAFFRETRGPVILREKARRLNEWHRAMEADAAATAAGEQTAQDTDRQELRRMDMVRWQVAADAERAGILQLLRTSLLRPFTMLFTEPVVFFFSLWAAFSWSVLYINLSAIPLVFETAYSFSLSSANAIFAASCIGSTVALALCLVQESLATSFWYTRKRDHQSMWNSVPEHRLYFSCVESLLLPLGLFLFGWSAQYQVHWIVPAVAVGISTVGIFSIYLSVFNYLADTYHRYASSALAAQSFCRNMLGGVFPLISRQMFTHLGFGAAASLLGGVGMALTLVPWILVWCGPFIRRRSKLAREIMD
ncbi:MFS general substrate transporter [Aspergillus brunneoviolaceus CBS 621.78]|uniref:MFS general substrate transporter n=1 Tax=Aspergillus brunneoviolaceus CBS 621.78 TaxID=1450534 RepID=A0ACD1GI57_9EURO|nr:MFS general substrate transporter [Aspergillus brunneoviolaceus CBS 621.78]RAH48941.1 MFS general substrate transporter [Aspergillus brunneoviolaceus CBS 621.78]